MDREPGIFFGLCAHPHTTAPDDDGTGICVDCGAVVQLVFTEAVFLEAWKRMLRRG